MPLIYIILLICSAILLLYGLLIGKFIRGWNNISPFCITKKKPETHVSIITACKNEVCQLPVFFQAINTQSYKNFELILIDDHSTDDSFELALEVQKQTPQLKVLKNSDTGKKQAIKTGVYQAKSDLIISLDADSIPSSDWLMSLVQFFEQKHPDLIICPVMLNSDGSLFHNLQQLEFSTLIGSGAGAVGVGMPILCNGANLAFRKSAWLESESELHFEEPSGDDIFLLQSIRRKNGKIEFLKSSDALTTTLAASNLHSFFRQRIRWASKHSAYTDKWLSYTALTVFLSSLNLVLTLILTLFYIKFAYLFFYLFTLKWIIDYIFLQKIRTFFGLKNVLITSLILSIIYPFYIIGTAIGALFKKTKYW